MMSIIDWENIRHQLVDIRYLPKVGVKGNAILGDDYLFDDDHRLDKAIVSTYKLIVDHERGDNNDKSI